MVNSNPTRQRLRPHHQLPPPQLQAQYVNREQHLEPLSSMTAISE